MHPIKRGKAATSQVARPTIIASASSPFYLLLDQVEEAVPPLPCWLAAAVHSLCLKSWDYPAAAVLWLSHANPAASPVTLPAATPPHLVLLIPAQSYWGPLDILPTPHPQCAHPSPSWHLERHLGKHNIGWWLYRKVKIKGEKSYNKSFFQPPIHFLFSHFLNFLKGWDQKETTFWLDLPTSYWNKISQKHLLFY